MKSIKKQSNGTAFIIFGSTGDLTKRKLIPALYKLYKNGVINKNPIICVGRRDISNTGFLELLNIQKFVNPADMNLFNKFQSLIHYYMLDSKNGSKEFNSYVKKIESKYKCNGNKIFYLALPSSLFEPTTEIIRKSGLLNGKAWKRVVFEKPFGYDLNSAKKLNKAISSVFKERNIYRIDHYLGKELVQNIMVLRFSNSVFEEVWNHNFVDHVQITMSERSGVGTRGDYYEKVGALKDVVQNHMLQVLSLVAMEPPKSTSSKDIKDQKIKVLKSLQQVKASNIVVGQYDRGVVRGKHVDSYKKDVKNSKSHIETFVGLKTFIDTKRWKNVPFYLRAGKRLNQEYAEVNLVLKDVAYKLFPSEKEHYDHNVISVRIQPDEGIAIRFHSKIPGTLKLYPVNMEFCHNCEFGANTLASYERLLSDVLKGSKTLFTRWDFVEHSWKFIDHLSKIIKKKKILHYKSGTSGPKEAEMLVKKDKKEWIKLERRVVL
ncbi:glucose-6-phosphate dehydrogenase [Candidatus Woesearchaeota archaeon]|nr:glucose-6-phosphate dehydrogenase [Candidatus Woesearchaeota archaeon]